MKGIEIKELLTDLTLLEGTNEESFASKDFKSICDQSSFGADRVFFCGAKKFFDFLKDQKHDDTLIIYSKKFFDGNEEEIKALQSANAFFGFVENMPVAMSYLSKPFYDELSVDENDEVDGRQMGTATVHPTAILSQNVFIGSNVTIEEGVRIYPGCVILSNSTIGANTVLYPNVSVMPRTTIGKGCRIHSNACIGSDGFGYNFHQGTHLKVWHVGGVVIGDDVEIGSNCSIDQGTFSPTQILTGAKLDNQVHVAHNNRLAEGVILCGQVGLAGSVKIGQFSVLGGQVAVAPDVEIGNQVQVGGKAGVTSNVEDKQAIGGHPARPLKEWLRGVAYIRKNALKK